MRPVKITFLCASKLWDHKDTPKYPESRVSDLEGNLFSAGESKAIPKKGRKKIVFTEGVLLQIVFYLILAHPGSIGAPALQMTKLRLREVNRVTQRY